MGTDLRRLPSDGARRRDGERESKREKAQPLDYDLQIRHLHECAVMSDRASVVLALPEWFLRGMR